VKTQQEATDLLGWLQLLSSVVKICCRRDWELECVFPAGAMFSVLFGRLVLASSDVHRPGLCMHQIDAGIGQLRCASNGAIFRWVFQVIVYEVV